MRIDFTMAANGSIDIDESELEGMTKSQKRDYIAEQVSAAAYEEVDSSLDWEISE
jgi:hypothetical protein